MSMKLVRRRNGAAAVEADAAVAAEEAAIVAIAEAAAAAADAGRLLVLFASLKKLPRCIRLEKCVLPRSDGAHLSFGMRFRQGTALLPHVRVCKLRGGRARSSAG